MSWVHPSDDQPSVTRSYGWEPGQTYTYVPIACCPKCGATKIWNTWHQDGIARLHTFQCKECDSEFRTEKKKAGRGVILE